MQVQYLTKNACYISGKPLSIKGIMVHSTGANNPYVKRYVPGNEIIGVNESGNHWNQHSPGGIKKCVHAFVGKFEDGSVGIVQTLPWNMRGWHSGTGKNGTANDTHIGFEICEDGLNDRNYLEEVYNKAVYLVSYLCKMYKLDPTKDGVIICHSEGYKRGIASNHGDVMHWWPRHGKSMDTFRNDVIKAMKGELELTEKQVREIARDEFLKIERERSLAPADSWASGFIEKGIELGLTSSVDGKTMDNPKSFPTRQEVVTMCVAAVNAANKEAK